MTTVLVVDSAAFTALSLAFRNACAAATGADTCGEPLFRDAAARALGFASLLDAEKSLRAQPLILRLPADQDMAMAPRDVVAQFARLVTARAADGAGGVSPVAFPAERSGPSVETLLYADRVTLPAPGMVAAVLGAIADLSDEVCINVDGAVHTLNRPSTHYALDGMLVMDAAPLGAVAARPPARVFDFMASCTTAALRLLETAPGLGHGMVLAVLDAWAQAFRAVVVAAPPLREGVVLSAACDAVSGLAGAAWLSGKPQGHAEHDLRAHLAPMALLVHDLLRVLCATGALALRLPNGRIVHPSPAVGILGGQALIAPVAAQPPVPAGLPRWGVPLEVVYCGGSTPEEVVRAVAQALGRDPHDHVLDFLDEDVYTTLFVLMRTLVQVTGAQNLGDEWFDHATPEEDALLAIHDRLSAVKVQAAADPNWKVLAIEDPRAGDGLLVTLVPRTLDVDSVLRNLGLRASFERLPLDSLTGTTGVMHRRTARLSA